MYVYVICTYMLLRTDDEEPGDGCAVFQHDRDGCGVHAALDEFQRAQGLGF